MEPFFLACCCGWAGARGARSPAHARGRLLGCAVVTSSIPGVYPSSAATANRACARAPQAPAPLTIPFANEGKSLLAFSSLTSSWVVRAGGRRLDSRLPQSRRTRPVLTRGGWRTDPVACEREPEHDSSTTHLAQGPSAKRKEHKQKRPEENPGRFKEAREDQASCLNTSRAAATVVAMSSAVCAALTNPASYKAGAMYTPRSSRPWNRVLNFAPSVFITVA